MARAAAKQAAEEDDNTAETRAAAALARIAEIESNEKSKEDEIISEAKIEASFRARYAQAFMEPLTKPLSGRFQMRAGIVVMKLDGNDLAGRGEEAIPESLFAGLLSKTSPQVKVIKIKGIIRGRSVEIEIETTHEVRGPVPYKAWGPQSVKGLLIISPDSNSLEVLEQDGGKVHVYNAERQT